METKDLEKAKAEKLQKRIELKNLSRKLVALRDTGEFMGVEDDTVNGLLRFYYATKGYKNLKTFNEWKKDGYTVRKGEKSILVWGTPIMSKSEKERIEELKKQGKEEDAKEDYFPVCHLFAESQVHKL